MAKDNRPPFIKLIKQTIIYLSIALFLFLGFQIFKFYGEKIAGSLLQEMVADQTNGAYAVSFGDMSISLLKKELIATDFNLTPNSSTLNDSTQNIFELSIPKLSFRLGSITKLYRSKELVLRGLVITDPKVKMYKYDQKKQSTFSLEAGDLYQLINDYLFRFSIESLDLEGGSLDYQNNANRDPIKFLLNDIDFTLKNLVIDSGQMKKNRFLFAEEMTLIITDQDFNLGDSIHQIHFDRFSISTKSRNILFENLSLKPRLHSLAGIGNERLNLYDITIPALNFRGVDFYKAYFENSLSIDSVRVSKPSLRIEQKAISGSRKVDNDLSALFGKLYDKLQIQRFYLDNASIDFVEVNDSIPNLQLKSEGTSLQLSNLDIDLNTLSSNTITQLINRFDLDASKIEFIHPEMAHQFNAESLTLSSEDSIVLLKNAQVSPLISDLKYFLNGSILSGELKGLDFERLLNLKELDIKRVNMQTPNITGSFPLKSKGSSKVKITSIDSISFSDGTINIQFDSINIKANNVKMGVSGMDFSGEKIDLLPSRFVLSSTQNSYNVSDRSITIENLNIQENGSDISASELEFTNGETDLPFKAKSLSLSQFQLKETLLKNQLIFDSLSILNPHFSIEIKSGASNNKFPEILNNPIFKSVAAYDGAFTLNKNDSIVLELNHFTFNTTSFRVDSISSKMMLSGSLNVDSIYLNLDSINHTITAQNLELSTYDSSFSLNNFKLSPNQESVKNPIRFTSEQLDIKRFDIQSALNNNSILFEFGEIKNPQIDLVINDTTSSQFGSSKSRIDFDSLMIVNGTLSFENTITGLSLNTQSFNLKSIGFNIRNDSLLLFSDNVILASKDLSVSFPRKDSPLLVSVLNFESATGKLGIEKVSFESDSIKLSIPFVSASGFEVVDLLHNKLNINQLSIQQPTFKMTASGNKNEISLPEITINDLDLQGGTIKALIPEFNRNDTLSLNRLGLNINDIQIANGSPLTLDFDYFNSFNIEGANLRYHLPDSLYDINIGDYQYSHVNKTIELNDISMVPYFSRNDFQTQLDFQKDWFDGSVRQLRAKNFHIDSLIQNNKVIMESLTIETLNLDTHRDKRLPRKEGIEKPLLSTALREVPFEITIDTIWFNNAFVAHSEFSSDGQLPGVIFFKDINASITNLTNDKSRTQERDKMIFEASGVLMETGDFELSVDFDLNSLDDRFLMRGVVGSMELTELNKFLEHTSYVYIRSGTSEKATFEFEANNRYSLGQMRFYYKDLKVSILDRETYLSKGHGSSIKSFFANTFIVNTKNPYFIFLRKGDIFHEKDPAKSIFNFWAKSILSGAVTSIGAKNNKKEIRTMNKEIKEELDNQLDD